MAKKSAKALPMIVETGTSIHNERIMTQSTSQQQAAGTTTWSSFCGADRSQLFEQLGRPGGHDDARPVGVETRWLTSTLCGLAKSNLVVPCQLALESH